MCHSGKKCAVLEYLAEVGMFYTLKELSPHTPLTKGGKGGSPGLGGIKQEAPRTGASLKNFRCVARPEFLGPGTAKVGLLQLN